MEGDVADKYPLPNAGFAIFSVPAQSYIVKILCGCGGDMIARDGRSKLVGTEWRHVCDRCGNEIWRNRRHPRVEHREIE